LSTRQARKSALNERKGMQYGDERRYRLSIRDYPIFIRTKAAPTGVESERA
jgi:hypothetical protein